MPAITSEVMEPRPRAPYASLESAQFEAASEPTQPGPGDWRQAAANVHDQLPN